MARRQQRGGLNRLSETKLNRRANTVRQRGRAAGRPAGRLSQSSLPAPEPARWLSGQRESDERRRASFAHLDKPSSRPRALDGARVWRFRAAARLPLARANMRARLFSLMAVEESDCFVAFISHFPTLF